MRRRTRVYMAVDLDLADNEAIFAFGKMESYQRPG